MSVYTWFKNILAKRMEGRMFQKFYFHILACSQIWLIIHVDHHHFGCIIKLTQKKKNTVHVIMCNIIHHT